MKMFESSVYVEDAKVWARTVNTLVWGDSYYRRATGMGQASGWMKMLNDLYGRERVETTVARNGMSIKNGNCPLSLAGWGHIGTLAQYSWTF